VPLDELLALLFAFYILSWVMAALARRRPGPGGGSAGDDGAGPEDILDMDELERRLRRAREEMLRPPPAGPDEGPPPVIPRPAAPGEWPLGVPSPRPAAETPARTAPAPAAPVPVGAPAQGGAERPRMPAAMRRPATRPTVRPSRPDEVFDDLTLAAGDWGAGAADIPLGADVLDIPDIAGSGGALTDGPLRGQPPAAPGAGERRAAPGQLPPAAAALLARGQPWLAAVVLKEVWDAPRALRPHRAWPRGHPQV